MEFKLQYISVVVFVVAAAVVRSHASLPSEDYWKSVLPNTPMPRALKHLLQPSTGQFHCSGCLEYLQVADSPQLYWTYGYGHGSSGVPSNTRGHRMNVGVEGVTFGTSTKTGKSQLHKDLNVTRFFLEKDLHPGKRMNLHFPKSANETKFLPRHVADSIPLSSDKLPKILNKMSVDPSSDEAVVIKETIKTCEITGVIGEDKLCATSLESMVDFGTSAIGKNVEVMCTDAKTGKTKEHAIVGVERMPARGKAVVVCHKLQYPYAVFYCHKMDKAVIYKVSMVAVDGLKAEAVAVCHQDTSAWNPKHLAFAMLKVKPGAVPICHFLYEDNVVWANKS